MKRLASGAAPDAVVFVVWRVMAPLGAVELTVAVVAAAPGASPILVMGIELLPDVVRGMKNMRFTYFTDRIVLFRIENLIDALRNMCDNLKQ